MCIRDSVGTGADGVAEIVGRQARHHGVKVNDTDAFAGGFIEQNIVDFGIIMGDTQQLCIRDRVVAGKVNADATALGSYALADDVQILDTTAEGVAGTVRPSRLAGTDLNLLNVR